MKQKKILILYTCLLLIGIGIINLLIGKPKVEEIEKKEVMKTANTNEFDINNIADNSPLTIEQAKLIVLNTRYPIGSIYISTSNINPSATIGGEWQSYGEGRTIIGAGTDSDINGTERTFTRYEDQTEAKNKGGEYTHKLQLAEIPSHVHSLASGSVSRANLVGYIWNYASNGPNASGIASKYKMDSTLRDYSDLVMNNNAPPTGIKIDASHNHTLSGNTGATGSTGTHNNIQPYIVTYLWKRTK